MPSGAERIVVRAPAVAECSLAVAVGVLACASDSAPEGYFLLIVISGIATLVLASWWLVRVLLATVVGWRRERLGAVIRQPGWWVMPGALLGLLALAATSLPKRVVLALERNRLDAAVQQAEGILAAAGDRQALTAVTVDFLCLPGQGHVEPYAMERLREWKLSWWKGEAGDWTAGGVAIVVPGTGYLFENGVYFHLPNRTEGPGVTPVPSNILVPLGGHWYAGRVEDDR